MAVEAFLAGQLGWLGIAEVVEDTLGACTNDPMDSAEAVLEADRRAREHARGVVARHPQAA